MNLQEQLNRIQEMIAVNESISPKNKMINLIEKKGLIETIKIIGIDNVAKTLDTTPIDLTRDFFIDKQFSIKDFDINTGGYDFNFMITDIDDQDDFWSIYVEILDGTVSLLTDDEYNPTDLWDSNLWEEEYWWEIQMEIDDIITDILKPFKERWSQEIHHNLR